MQPLYKRLLLTLFPDEMKQADINPATMFVSSLSAKEFFSLLSRKVTEYYKTNGFDTGLETFEAKIGLGQEQGITMRKANDYYGYLIAAQYAGKGFFSPTFVATHITLYSATILAPLLREEPDELLIHTMITLYVMPLLFVTHIKRFPIDMDQKDQYNRFVTLCLEIFRFVMEEENEEAVQTINRILNHESTVLRNLLIVCQHAEHIFPIKNDHIDEYRSWMLDAHAFDHQDALIVRFLADYHTQSMQPSLHNDEEEVMNMIFPNDFSIRGLYDQIGIHDSISTIITPRYRGQDGLKQVWQTLADEPDQWSDLLRMFSDVTHAKGDFWQGVQQFIIQHRTTQQQDIREDIDDFMSSIEDGGTVDMDSVPESIKMESRVIDQIVHFYIGVVGGHRGAKNDSFRYRWIQDDWSTLQPAPRAALTATSQAYWRDHFSLYDINGFYYQRAWEHIRQGKQKFHIPLRASLRYRTDDHTTQAHIASSSLMYLLSDTLPSRMRLTLHQSTILELFGDQYAHRIRAWIDDDYDLASHQWSLIDSVTGAQRSQTAHHITNLSTDHPALRDALYRLDRWLWYDMIDSIHHDQETLQLLQSLYDDRTILVLLSNLKKTLLGLMLRIRYEEEHHQSQGSGLWQLYLRDVLHIDSMLWTPLHELLQGRYKQQRDLLELWIQIDDNQVFLSMCSRMRHDFQHASQHTLNTEDILWLHSTLHHISAYNTRYIIPE